MDTWVGILIDLMEFRRVLCRSEEFGSKYITGGLSGEGIMCVKYIV